MYTFYMQFYNHLHDNLDRHVNISSKINKSKVCILGNTVGTCIWYNSQIYVSDIINNISNKCKQNGYDPVINIYKNNEHWPWGFRKRRV